MTKLSELLGRLLEARKRFQISVPKVHAKKAEAVLGIAPSGATNGDVTFDYPSPAAGKSAIDALRDAGISGKTLGWTELEEGMDEELTRRYYQAFAEILKRFARERVAREIATELADFFARDNPRFSRERFLRAAGMALRPEVTLEPEPVPSEESVSVSEVYEPDLKKFVKGYLEAALWSSTDEEGEPLDKFYTMDDFSEEAVERVTKDAREFIADNEADLDATEASYEQHGRDFWLTRNRHGTGFWDRGYGEAGERLTKAAHAYGEAHVIVGDDGKLHIFEG